MTFRTIHAGGLAAVLALGACADARAAYDDYFDPDQVSKVGPSDATSTCIGDPRTPECALDTLFACAVRRDPELCRRVGVVPPFPEPCFDPRILDARYKIKGIRTLAEKDMPPYLRKEKREGEVFVRILYDGLFCRSFNLPCARFNFGSAETLKSSGLGWVFTWFPWEADQCDSGDD